MAAKGISIGTDERKAFDYLFNKADSEQLGVLTGDKAVEFFDAAQLPPQILGEIWALADDENTGFLTKDQFYAVCRMIGHAQHGVQDINPALLKKAGPLPVFKGMTIPGVSASRQGQGQPPSRQGTASPAPPASRQPQQPQQQQGISISPEDKTKYTRLFYNSGAVNGLLDGDKARDILMKSRLPNETLGQIWNLSDTQSRGSLDATDFTIAMALINATMSGKLPSLPDTLPVSVYAQAAAAPPGGAAGVLPSSPLRAQMTGGSAAGPLYPQATGQGQRGPLGGMSASQSQGSLSGFSSAGAGGAAWAISPAEKAQSDQFFSMLDTARSGYITGDVAVPFFIQSGLPEDTLASIWDLADLTKEGNLNAAEFAVARRLIMDALQGKPVPQTLEESMIPPAMRSQVRQIQQHPQQSEVQKDLFSLMDDDDEPSAPVLPAATAASAFQPMSSFSSPQQQPARVTSPAPMQPMQPQRTGGSVARGFPAPIVPTPTGGSARSGTAMRSPPPPVPSSRSGSVLSAPAPAPAPAASRHTFETNFHDDSDDDDVSAAPAPASVSASRAQEQEQAPDRSGELDDLRKQVSSAQQRASGLRDQRTALSESTAKVDAEIDELKTKLAQAKAAYDVESTNLSNLEARQKTGNDELKRLRSETISAESDLSAAREQKIELEQGILKDKEEVRDLGKKLKTTNDEVASLKTELEKLKKEARQQKGLLAVHRKQASTAESERDKMRSAIEQEKQDASATAAELASLQSQAQSNRASPSAVPLPASNVASPAPSVGSQRSMNPFFATGGLAAPVAAAARAPSPLAAFDSAPTSHEQTAEEELDPFGVSTSPRAASPFGSSAQPQPTQQPASMSGFDDAFGASSEPVSTGAVPTQQELEQQPVAATVGVLRGAEPTPGANTAFDDAFAEFDSAPAAAVASGEQAGTHNQEREVPADAKEGEAAADSGVGAAAAAVVGAAGAAIGAAAAGVYALASGEESTSPASVTDAPTGPFTAEDKGKGREVQGGEGDLQDSSITLSAPASTQAYESRAINDDGSDSGDEVGDGSADLPPIKDMEIADNDDDSDSESDESVAGGTVARSDGGRGGLSAIPASTTPYGQSPYDPSPFGDSSSVPAGEDQAAQPEDTAEAGPARAVKGSDPFPGAFPASGTGSAGSSVGDADEAFEDARSTSAGPHSSTSPAIAAFSSPPQVQLGELPLPVTAGPGAGLDSSAQPQSATSTGFDDTFASATEAAQPSRGTSSDSPAREEAFLAAVPTAGGPAPAAGSAVQAETDDFDDFEDLAPARMEEPSAQVSGTSQPTHAAGSSTFNDNFDDDFGFDKQTFSHTITSAGVGKATEPVGVVASPSHSRGPSGGRSGGFDDAFDDAFGVPATTSATGVTGTSSKPSAAAVGFDDDFFSSPMPTQSASTTADNNNGSNAGNASGFGSDFSSSSLPAGAAPYRYSMSADGQPQMHVVSSTPVVTSSASNPPPVAPGEPAPSYAPPPGPPPASAYQQSQSQQREPRQSAIPPTPPRAQSQSQSRQAPAITDRRGTPTGTPSSARRSGRQDPTEGADTSGDLPAVKELVNMGFKRSQAIAALEDNQFNLERAANALLAVNQ